MNHSSNTHNSEWTKRFIEKPLFGSILLDFLEKTYLQKENTRRLQVIRTLTNETLNTDVVILHVFESTKNQMEK